MPSARPRARDALSNVHPTTSPGEGDPAAASSLRPRERLLLHGATALSEVELVAVVLGGGHAPKRARELLERLGGLDGLSTPCPHELLRIPGIGMASATALCAGMELGRRIGERSLGFAHQVRGPKDLERYLRATLGDLRHEEFMVLGLDSRQRVRLVRTVARGTLAQVDVHPREVFRPVLRAAMHSIIVVHNHPSGDAEPSDADLELTQRLCEVGRLVGIPVLDHIIVTARTAVSLASLGHLPAALSG